MKKMVVILMVMLGIAFVSCDNGTTDIGTTNDNGDSFSLAGVWRTDSIGVSIPVFADMTLTSNNATFDLVVWGLTGIGSYSITVGEEFFNQATGLPQRHGTISFRNFNWTTTATGETYSDWYYADTNANNWIMNFIIYGKDLLDINARDDSPGPMRGGFRYYRIN